MSTPDGRDAGMDGTDDGGRSDDVLAAEYVVGTLELLERRGVDARREDDAAFERRIRAWERRLQPLAATVPAVAPSVDCDRRIAATIRRASDAGGQDERGDLPAESRGSARAGTNGATRGESGQRIRAADDGRRVTPLRRASGDEAESLARSLGRWRALAVAASVAAIGLATALLVDRVRPLGDEATGPIASAPPVDAPGSAVSGGGAERTALSLLRDETGRARYLVEIGDDDSVSITALDRADAAEAGSLQLWMADGESGDLRSVGLLPRDDWSSVRLADVPLAEQPAFAVSVEPPGGSPVQGPTGEVVFQGSIHPVEDGF